MNVLRGVVQALAPSGNLTLVGVDVCDVAFAAIVIGNPETMDYLQIGGPVEVLFNESEVSLGKNIGGHFSQNNQIDCAVIDLTKGEIFTRVGLMFHGQHITSLITSASANRLTLQTGDRVTALIKSNEVFLKQCIDPFAGAHNALAAEALVCEHG